MPMGATSTAKTASSKPDIFAQAFDNPIVGWVIKILVAIAIVFFLIMISRIIASIVRNKIIQYGDNEAGSKQTEQIADLMKDIVFYSLVIFSFFIGFEILGLDVGLILGGVAFGIGLAFKEILGNMIAGIFLLTMKEIKLGDTISIAMSGGPYFGKIEEIGIRMTTLRLIDNKQVFLPNIKLIDAAIQTFSSEEIIRLGTKVDVHYDTDLDFATEVIKSAVISCQFVKNPDKTKVFVATLGASSISFKVFFYVDPNCGRTVEQLIGYVNHVITAYCRANNIIIPYNHTTVKFEGKLAEIIQKLGCNPALLTATNNTATTTTTNT